MEGKRIICTLVAGLSLVFSGCFRVNMYQDVEARYADRLVVRGVKVYGEPTYYSRLAVSYFPDRIPTDLDLVLDWRAKRVDVGRVTTNTVKELGGVLHYADTSSGVAVGVLEAPMARVIFHFRGAALTDFGAAAYDRCPSPFRLARKAGTPSHLPLLDKALRTTYGSPQSTHKTRLRSFSARNACVNNLRQLDAAKEQWAMATGQPVHATSTAKDVAPYIKGGTENLTCPADPLENFRTSYAIHALGQDPVCKVCSNHTL